MKHGATSTTCGALLLLVAGGGVVGCSAYSTYRNVAPDCNVESAYALQVVDAFDTVGPGAFWMSADTADAGTVPLPPPASYVASAVEPISDGPRCGSTAALVIRSERNNDWGSLFGINIGSSRDASAYDGLSFWARAPGNTTNAFTILLNDPNTAVPPVMTDAKCKEYGVDGGTAGQPMVDGTGMIIPGTITDAPEPDQCGNPYSVVQVVTSNWRFYTIPFSAFQQGPTPNRVPNVALMEIGPEPGTALLTSSLLSLTLRMPKAATTELWIDNLSFYRPAAAPGTGGDGGVDAAQM
jgi:hypothetical protein